MPEKKSTTGLIRAAIYARKSNDDNDKVADNKSITRQIEGSKEYIERKGWVWDESTIYIDDGVPGPEFVNRPGLRQLCRETDSYDVIVTSELSRIGRDGGRTEFEIVALIEDGKRIFYYLTDEEEKAGTPLEKLMLRIRTYAAEAEREKLSERVKDKLYRLAKDGFCAGGPVYGYTRIRNDAEAANGGRASKGSEYVIDEEERFIVLAIFHMYRDGHGYDTIAKILNGDANPRIIEKRLHYLQGVTPKLPRKTSTAWSGPTVRAILRNTKYRGEFSYGKKNNGYLKGKKTTIIQKDPSKIVICQRPDLRIVDDELWVAVSRRMDDERRAYEESTRSDSTWGGKAVGSERDSKYLLSALAKCSICGQSIISLGGSSGSGANRRPDPKYGCRGHKLGSETCENDHKVRVALLDKAVLMAIQEQVFSQDSVDYVVEAVLEALGGPDDSLERVKHYEQELNRVNLAISNMIRLVRQLGMDGEEPDEEFEQLSKDIKEHRYAKKVATTALERANAIARHKTFDESAARELLKAKMDDFHGLMAGNVSIARKALKALLPSKILVTPVERDGKKGFQFQGETTVGNLLSDPDADPEPGVSQRDGIKNHPGLNSGSAAFEAWNGFAVAKPGRGSNVRCNVLLGGEPPPTLHLNAVRLIVMDTPPLCSFFARVHVHLPLNLV